MSCPIQNFNYTDKNGNLFFGFYSVVHKDWPDWTLQVFEHRTDKRNEAFSAIMRNEKYRMHLGSAHAPSAHMAIRLAISDAALSPRTIKYLTVDGRPPFQAEIPKADVYIDDWVDEWTSPPVKSHGVALMP